MLLPIVSPITVTFDDTESGTILKNSGRATDNAYDAKSPLEVSSEARRAIALTVLVTAKPSGATTIVFVTASETPAMSVVATNVTATSPSDVGAKSLNVALAKEPAATATTTGDPTGVVESSSSQSTVSIRIVAVTSRDSALYTPTRTTSDSPRTAPYGRFGRTKKGFVTAIFEAASSSSAAATPRSGCVANARNCQLVIVSGATRFSKTPTPVAASTSKLSQTHVSGKNRRVRVSAAPPESESALPESADAEDDSAPESAEAVSTASFLNAISGTPSSIIATAPSNIIILSVGSHEEVFMAVSRTSSLASTSAGGQHQDAAMAVESKGVPASAPAPPAAALAAKILLADIALRLPPDWISTETSWASTKTRDPGAEQFAVSRTASPGAASDASSAKASVSGSPNPAAGSSANVTPTFLAHATTFVASPPAPSCATYATSVASRRIASVAVNARVPPLVTDPE